MRGLCGIYARHTIRRNTGSRVLFAGSAYECPTTSLSSVGSRRTTSRNIVWQTGHSNERMSCPLTRGSTAVSVRSTLRAEHTGNELGRRERLLQQDAVGDSLRRPFVRSRACHVDDRERRVFFPDLSRRLPTAQAALQANVGDERLVVL